MLIDAIRSVCTDDAIVVSEIPYYLDLLWEGDLGWREIQELPSFVLVEGPGHRQIVVGRVRGQWRYHITTDARPNPEEVSYEIGTVLGVEQLVALCEEFAMGGASLAGLVAPREIRRLDIRGQRMIPVGDTA